MEGTDGTQWSLTQSLRQAPFADAIPPAAQPIIAAWYQASMPCNCLPSALVVSFAARGFWTQALNPHFSISFQILVIMQVPWSSMRPSADLTSFGHSKTAI